MKWTDTFAAINCAAKRGVVTMKVLLINSVCGIRSTGRICTDIAAELEAQGHEVKIAYGREHVPEKAFSGIEGWVDCFEKAEFAGSLFCGGINDPGEAALRKEEQDEAYAFGKSLQ